MIILIAFLAVATALCSYFIPPFFDDILYHIQTKQGIAFALSLLILMTLCFYKRILNQTLSQTKSSYTHYVKSYIYTKNFLLILTYRSLMVLVLCCAAWSLCSFFDINFFHEWFDSFMSPEHWILSFFLASLTFHQIHRSAIKKSKENIYKYYQTRGRYISKDTKDYVYKRDKGRCRQCRSRKNLEYDHIKPYSKGGKNIPDNIQLLCRKCNRSKGAK